MWEECVTWQSRNDKSWIGVKQQIGSVLPDSAASRQAHNSEAQVVRGGVLWSEVGWGSTSSLWDPSMPPSAEPGVSIKNIEQQKEDFYEEVDKKCSTLWSVDNEDAGWRMSFKSKPH